jgi:hypothetical protein
MTINMDGFEYKAYNSIKFQSFLGEVKLSYHPGEDSPAFLDPTKPHFVAFLTESHPILGKANASGATPEEAVEALYTLYAVEQCRNDFSRTDDMVKNDIE